MRSIRSYSLQFLIIACVMIVTLFVTYRFLVEYPRDLAAIEEHQKREIESLSEALSQSLTQLHTVVRHWAHADDTSNFMADPAAHAFLNGNVVPATFELFSLTGIGYYDSQLDPLMLQGYDLGAGRWAPFEQAFDRSLEDLFTSNPRIVPTQFNTGWLMTDQGPAAFAVDYVTSSGADKVPDGFMLVIKLITDAQLESLEEITRLELELEPVAPDDLWAGNIPRLGSAGLEEGFQQTRKRVLTDPMGVPVALLTITHDPIAYPITVGQGELIILLGLVLVPIVVMGITDHALLKPLQRSASRIDDMVRNEVIKRLPQEFPVTELEQMRGAFNRTVSLVRSQQKRLTKLTRTDALTGIPNRRAFDWSADNVWRQAKRSRQSLLLGLLDLDYFKEFNDEYGHPKGDEALQAMAKTLASFARRSGDFCARIGGEEFAIVALGLSEEEGRQWIEALRHAIENLDIANPGSQAKLTITASIGVLYIAEPSGTDPGITELMPLADKALYCAKHEGRNRVHFKLLKEASAPA